MMFLLWPRSPPTDVSVRGRTPRDWNSSRTRHSGAAESGLFNKEKYLDTPTLVLTLEEERTSGELVFLGEYSMLLGDTLLVTEDGPNGRWLVEMQLQPVTAPLEALSLVNACVTPVEHTKHGDVVGAEICRELMPILPL